MLRTTFIILFIARAWAAPVQMTSDELIRSTVRELQGSCEPASKSKRVDPAGARSQVCSAGQDAPSTEQSDNRTPAVVSAKHLKHKVPGKAMKALKKAEKLAQQNRPAEAATELQQAIDLDPEFSEAHGELGVQFAVLNKLADAEAELRRALQLDPSNTLHYSNLGWVLLKERRFDEAAASGEQALRLAPGNAPAHMLIAAVQRDRPKPQTDDSDRRRAESLKGKACLR
jgi:tetratricopeptide (TPR) repeat protein